MVDFLVTLDEDFGEVHAIVQAIGEGEGAGSTYLALFGDSQGAPREQVVETLMHPDQALRLARAILRAVAAIPIVDDAGVRLRNTASLGAVAFLDLAGLD